MANGLGGMVRLGQVRLGQVNSLNTSPKLVRHQKSTPIVQYSEIVRTPIVQFSDLALYYSEKVRSPIVQQSDLAYAVLSHPLLATTAYAKTAKSPHFTVPKKYKKVPKNIFCRSGICRSVPPHLDHNGIYMPLWHMPFRSLSSGTERCICRSVPPPYAVPGFCRSGALPNSLSQMDYVSALDVLPSRQIRWISAELVIQLNCACLQKTCPQLAKFIKVVSVRPRT